MAQSPGSLDDDDGKVFGFRTWGGEPRPVFFDMGRVGGRWQVILVANEQFFVKRDPIGN